MSDARQKGRKVIDDAAVSLLEQGEITPELYSSLKAATSPEVLAQAATIEQLADYIISMLSPSVIAHMVAGMLLQQHGEDNARLAVRQLKKLSDEARRRAGTEEDE